MGNGYRRNGEYCNGDYFTFHKPHEPQTFECSIADALKGDVESQFRAGMNLLHNSNHPMSLVHAELLLSQAAEQGHVGAQLNYARMLWSGFRPGAQADPGAAMIWFRRAAEQGDAEAMHELGARLVMGGEVERDLKNAFHWIEMSASRGFPSAFVTLGTFYLNGEDGYVRDTEKAVKLYIEAHRLGAIEASYALGLMYLEGDVVIKNVPQGLKYLRTAVERQMPLACHELGVLYLEGGEVERDTGLAERWLTKAAEMNHGPSQYLLGTIYLNGEEGIRRDVQTAEYWLEKARRSPR